MLDATLRAVSAVIPRGARFWIFATIALLAASPLLHGQTYLNATGNPTFGTMIPIENGTVNIANGNLHLEIPIGSFPQRGKMTLVAKMVYDGRIWQVVNNGTSSAWQPNNLGNTQAGWRFVTSVDPGTVGFTPNSNLCNGTQSIQTWQNFVWTDPDGTQRIFPITTTQNQCTGANTSTGDAYAQDGTGFHMYITNFTTATVFAKDGTQAYPSVKDTNGNFFTLDGNGNVIDTLNRTPVTKTVSGPNTFYDVLNSRGTTSRFTVTTSAINVSTAFGQAGVSEYSGTLTAVSSISLPDGTSYTFTYDSGTTPGFYGLLASMTLRTGGTVQYGYTNFSDAYGNISRWLTSRTAAGVWSYTPTVLSTCAPLTTGCQQQVTLSKPSGDESVYTFTLDNGGWNTLTQHYTATAGTGTLLRTIARDFDFTNPCSTTGCFGHADINPLRVTTTEIVPGGTLSNKSEFSYDTPTLGSIVTLKEWNFYSGAAPATPDRETDMVYLTTSGYVAKDIHDLVTSMTIKNAAGTQLEQTLTTYDNTALTAITGITHHDDTNFGTANTVRGNSTNVQRWVSGTTYLTTTSTYDTTGQGLQVTNPRGHTRTYSYANNFYTDANTPVNPPAAFTPTVATNAYVTQITLNETTGSPKLHFGYYFATGKKARDQDANLADIFHHYVDPLERQTHLYERKLTNGTRGWTLTVYTSPTTTDSYHGITDTTASSSCVSCRHDQTVLDSFGRSTTSILVSDPQGAVEEDTGFDTNNRQITQSNPYRSTSDPTYGIETTTYDGLDRAIQQTHSDGNIIHIYHGAAVSAAGGATAQSCSSTTYGLGYPVLTVDEAGKKKQQWINAFGSMVEVDEPDSTNALTQATCYGYDALQNNTQVSQGTQVRTYAYDGISRQVSASEPESGTTHYFFTSSTGSICSGAGDVCRKTDSRGVTTTYIYDIGSERDRLNTISYSDTTPTINYSYDQTSFNGLSIAFGGDRLTGISDASGQTAWSYDPHGHVVAERRTIGTLTKTTSYTYNVDGSIATITYPSGRTITYTYNNAMRIVSAVDATNHINYATSATYNPDNKLASVVYGNVAGGFAGITRTRAYNSRLQATSIIDSTPSGPIRSFSYSYDQGGGINNGKVITATDNLVAGRSQSFTYDTLNRVATAQSQATSGPDCWGQSLGYDRYGNLTTANVTQCSAPALSLLMNGANQISNSGFSYDTAGNMTNDGTDSYAYNAENQLTSTAGVTYTYDGLGLRVKQSSGEIDCPARMVICCSKAIRPATSLRNTFTSLGEKLRYALPATQCITISRTGLDRFAQWLTPRESSSRNRTTILTVANVKSSTMFQPL